jgi:hypothetical protein
LKMSHMVYVAKFGLIYLTFIQSSFHSKITQFSEWFVF